MAKESPCLYVDDVTERQISIVGALTDAMNIYPQVILESAANDVHSEVDLPFYDDCQGKSSEMVIFVLS